MQRFKKHLFEIHGKLNLGRYDTQGAFTGFDRIVPAQIPMNGDFDGKFRELEGTLRGNLFIYLNGARGYGILAKCDANAVARVWAREMLETAAYARRRHYNFKLPA